METHRIGPAGETVDTPRHRALASASRVAILRLVRAAPAGLTTGDVATATGLHPSTVRAHLDRLTGAGLLLRERGCGGVPGRPAWRYLPAAPDPAPAPYRALAAALLHYLDETGDGAAAVARAGAGWGRRLAAGIASGTDPFAALAQVLDGLGFAPEPAPRDAAPASAGEHRLHLRTCPFLELVAGHAEAMCRLHGAMIRGVLAAAGGRDEAVLEPFGAPTACVVRLPAAGRPEAVR